jgi:hypothetical protein
MGWAQSQAFYDRSVGVQNLSGTQLRFLGFVNLRRSTLEEAKVIALHRAAITGVSESEIGHKLLVYANDALKAYLKISTNIVIDEKDMQKEMTKVLEEEARKVYSISKA